MTTTTEERLIEVLRDLPVSRRQVAGAAGVSTALLDKIASGDRSATPETLEKVRWALERYADQLRDAARSVRALEREEREERGEG